MKRGGGEAALMEGSGTVRRSYLLDHGRFKGSFMNQQRAIPGLLHNVVAGTGIAAEDDAPPIQVPQGEGPCIRTMLYRDHSYHLHGCTKGETV